jgi:alanine-glyoxylate transaminase/serine-glyoxylate transaminase/serine-pyruvate transaminase
MTRPILQPSALVSNIQKGFPLLIYSRPLSALSNRTTTEPLHTSRLAALAHRRVYPAINKLGTPPHSRLSVISRHLDPRPPIPINTPYSIERIPRNESTQARSFSSDKPKMSSQPHHPTLLIPGPIEFDDAVLQSMSHYTYGSLIIFLLIATSAVKLELTLAS